MKSLAFLAIIIFLVNITGCATTKTLQATGGSRADGTVKMAYEYGQFEKPQPKWNQAKQSAQQRCKAWGYTRAEKFGGGLSKCVSRNGYGCVKHRVTVTYQCTGGRQ